MDSLDALKDDLEKNGFNETVVLAIDPVTFKCNLHDGNHRITCAKELNLKWIPVRIIRLSMGENNKYKYAPQIPNVFPTCPCPCDFGFSTHHPGDA